MKSSLAFLAVVAVSACGGKPIQLSGPAPQSSVALECALTAAGELGYTAVDGGVASGFIKAERKLGTGRKVRDEALVRVATMGLGGANSIDRDWLTIQAAQNRLQVSATGVRENGDTGKPSKDGSKHAEQILHACSTRPTDARSAGKSP